jgi:hypothetical protein
LSKIKAIPVLIGTIRSEKAIHLLFVDLVSEHAPFRVKTQFGPIGFIWQGFEAPLRVI